MGVRRNVGTFIVLRRKTGREIMDTWIVYSFYTKNFKKNEKCDIEQVVVKTYNLK